MRVIDKNGQQIGVLSLGEALKIALEQKLDLIEIAPNAVPPVAKIMDYGKYLYREEKEERKQKAKQSKDEMKTIRLTAKIGPHDMEIKAGRANEFVKEGLRVRVELMLRGREKYQKTIQDLSRKKVENFIKMIAVPTKVVQELRKDPRGFSIVVMKK